MNIGSKILLLFLCFMSLSRKSYGNPSAQDFIIPGTIEVLHEKISPNPLTPEQARSAPSWYKERSAVLNFGSTRDIYWLKFQVRHDNQKIDKLIVDLGSNELSEVVIKVYGGKTLELIEESSYIFGSRLPYKSRPIDSNNLAVPVDIEANEIKTVLVRLTGDRLGVSLTVSTEDRFHSILSTSNTLNGLLIGGLIATCLYNFFLFFSTKDRIYLYYSLFITCTTLINANIKGLGIRYVFPDHPLLILTVNIVLINAAIVTGSAFSILFLDLRKMTPRFYQFTRFMMVIHTLAALSLFVLPAEESLRLTLIVVIVGACLPVIAGTLLFNKSRVAKFYLFSLSVAGFGGLILLLTGRGLIPLNFFTLNSFLIGNFIEAMLLSFALGYRLNQLKASLAFSNKELANLNNDLEKKVIEKTRKIRTILDSIPQGVFTVESEVMIRGEVSARLPEILESEEINNQSLSTILLERSDLSSDQKDRIFQSLFSAIDESLLNFQVNSSNLPSELVFKCAKKESKILSLTWDPIVDENDQIERILVTVMDVTLAKKLEKELAAQQEDMKIIKQLVDCGEKKFAKFSATIEPILSENTRLIDNLNSEQDLAIINILFINLHTAKGAARTLGLMKMADALHEAERYYASLIKAQEAFVHERLKEDNIKVKAVYSEYERVNSVELGRKYNSKTVIVNRDFLSSQFEMLRGLVKLNPISSYKDISQDLSNAIQSLSKMIFSDLNFVLDDCFSGSERIAKDLGKPNPKVTIDKVNLSVSNEVEEAMQKVMVHIIRNIMDHGIEDQADRLAKGKSQNGNIRVEIKQSKDSLTRISIQDDGRGLAIRKIREKTAHLNTADGNASPQEIANRIFLPGLSTANTVSQISGRGVGMDAVKRFTEDMGGQIWLELIKPLDDNGDYYSFKTILEIPTQEQNVSQVANLYLASV